MRASPRHARSDEHTVKSPTTKSDKVLVIVLRYLVGIGGLFALVPVFMPFSWTIATHRWLGLGEMFVTPKSPAKEGAQR